jgi:hypothetical protein
VHPVLEALLPVVSGTFVLGGFAWGVLGLVQLRSAEGPLVRGTRVWSRPVPPEELAALRQLPERSAGAWGWARREGAHVAVFADPYSTEDGIRVSTPWPYRAVVHLEAETPVLEYRAPTGFLVSLGLVLLPLAPLLLLLNHALQAGRIDARLAALRAG